MRKITINAIVDIGCLVTFIPSLISGLVLYLVLPSGGGRGGGSGSYLGIARDQWLNMHNYTSLVFAALIIIHLILHWMYFRNIRKCLTTKEKATCDMPAQ
jgi:preprotein translocase subunit SecG